MRLNKAEIYALKEIFNDLPYKVYLFGSRVNDNLKAGDIDLLILADLNKKEQFVLNRKLSIKFFSLYEQKLDIVIINPKKVSKKEQAFLNTIKKIDLKKLWNNYTR